MLARVPNARRTLDADLYREGFDKDRALADLRRVAGIDLGDFFQFVYRKHRAILPGDIQPYTDGYRFDAFLGAKQIDAIRVDLSTRVGATESLTVVDPANRLYIPLNAEAGPAEGPGAVATLSDVRQVCAVERPAIWTDVFIGGADGGRAVRRWSRMRAKTGVGGRAAARQIHMHRLPLDSQFGMSAQVFTEHGHFEPYPAVAGLADQTPLDQP
jgi:hypothetical protein